MTDEQKIKCHAIIHSASASAAAIGGGLAQIPGSDAPILIGIQTAMVMSIGKVFDKTIGESSAHAAIVSATASTIGRTVSQVLIGWIPVVGNTINATTAAGLTEAIGWAIAKEFDLGML